MGAGQDGICRAGVDAEPGRHPRQAAGNSAAFRRWASGRAREAAAACERSLRPGCGVWVKHYKAPFLQLFPPLVGVDSWRPFPWDSGRGAQVPMAHETGAADFDRYPWGFGSRCEGPPGRSASSPRFLEIKRKVRFWNSRVKELRNAALRSYPRC